MAESARGRDTLEFKREVTRLVESGQGQVPAARSLGKVEQTSVSAQGTSSGVPKGAIRRPQLTVEESENSRLRDELARVTLTDKGWSRIAITIAPHSRHDAPNIVFYIASSIFNVS